MNILHPDGHLIAALFICPIAAFWIVGMVNGHLAAQAQKRANR